MTAPIVHHSIGRSGGQSRALAAPDDRDDQEWAAEGHDGQGGQQDVGEPGQGRGGTHEGFAPARAAIRSRQ